VPYNGSGTFNLYTPGNPTVAGTTITDTWWNATSSDIATALSSVITKDGQTVTTVNINFAQGITVATNKFSVDPATGDITAGSIASNGAITASGGLKGYYTFSQACVDTVATTVKDMSTVLAAGQSCIVVLYNSTNGKGMGTGIVQRDGLGAYAAALIGTQPTANYIGTFSMAGANLQVTMNIGAGGPWTMVGTITPLASS
jgi:hypothetical protein